MRFQEGIAKMKSMLNEMLTADNTDAITSLDKELDNIVEAHKSTEEELHAVKDKLIEVVRGTSFKAPSQEGAIEDTLEEDKSIDDIMLEKLNKIK